MVSLHLVLLVVTSILLSCDMIHSFHFIPFFQQRIVQRGFHGYDRVQISRENNLVPMTRSRERIKLNIIAHSTVNSDISSNNNSGEKQIDLLYDSECPICMMEVEFLQKRDIESRIKFTDLSSPDYRPQDHGNVEFADGMRKIRAVLPDGKVVTGVEVFRQTYKAIGLGWVFQATNIPFIGKAADVIYDIWSENRLRITGRGDLADVLKERSEKLKDMEPPECDSDACSIEYD